MTKGWKLFQKNQNYNTAPRASFMVMVQLREDRPHYYILLIRMFYKTIIKKIEDKDTNSENLYRDFDVYRARALQMVYIGPSSSHHWHLAILPVLTLKLVCRRIMCLAYETRRWQLALLWRLLQIACKPLGPLHATGLWDWICPYGWEVMDSNLYSITRDFTSFETLRYACFGNGLHQTPTWSKLLPPGYRKAIQICDTPGYKPSCHVGTNPLNVNSH